jgi:hypothetical protein
MGHGPCTFKEADLARALRAARKAGIELARIEIDRDGKIVLVMGKVAELATLEGDKANIERNEWDEELYGRDQIEVRKQISK